MSMTLQRPDTVDASGEVIAADGLRLQSYFWGAVGARPRAALCLVHGIGEHASRYARLAEAFATRGYALAAIDLRGHGRSEGRRGDAPSYAALLDDVRRLVEAARARWPEASQVLYGHSLGGNVALNYVLRCPLEGPRAAIVTGPWLRLAMRPPAWKLTLAEVAGRLWPTYTQQSGLEGGAMSHDAAWVDASRADPLNHGCITARLYLLMRDAARWAMSQAPTLQTPVLLMHGAADAVTDCQASSEFAAAAGPRCTFRAWPGLYHEIHNEPQRQEVYAAMLDWLDAEPWRSATGAP